MASMMIRRLFVLVLSTLIATVVRTFTLLANIAMMSISMRVRVSTIITQVLLAFALVTIRRRVRLVR